MGCWGITAFESDAGLDAVDLIRENLPDDGKMNLKTMIRLLQGRWMVFSTGRNRWGQP